MLQTFRVPRDVDWWACRETPSKLASRWRVSFIVCTRHIQVRRFVVIGIPAVAAVYITLVVWQPANRRATNGTPANNMAKDYLMRTFRFILLLNWICHHRKNTRNPTSTVGWAQWDGESVRGCEKNGRRNGENYTISSTVTYFSSFLLSSGYAWVPASKTHNIPYPMRNCKRLVYILRAYTISIWWRWQRIRKTPIKIMIILILGEFLLDSTQHRSTHTNTATINTSVCGVTSRAHLTKADYVITQKILISLERNQREEPKIKPHYSSYSRTLAMIPNLLFSRLVCENPDLQTVRLELVEKGRAFPRHWMARRDGKIVNIFMGDCIDCIFRAHHKICIDCCVRSVRWIGPPN